MSSKPVEQLSQVIVRFAGDSGDGMQLTGSQFTSEAALLGNDISTLPDFPAEIRAPAGSLPGVSGFQLHFADHDILTPGDAPGAPSNSANRSAQTAACCCADSPSVCRRRR